MRSDRTGLALVTIAAGRHRHLRRQLDGVAAAENGPDQHVIVAMGDRHIRDVTQDRPATRVIDLPCGSGPLPLAAARNLGARVALDGGAEMLVFLDVDCVPGPDLFTRYRRSMVQHAEERLIFCGPVTYLRPDQLARPTDLRRLTDPHPVRPDPPDTATVIDSDLGLFWSLSFAMAGHRWQETGGFHTGYAGYGGEDTDFAMIARQRGFRLAWVGGAHAYHQHHPVSDPPVEHLDDILRNAELFHRRWGWWPMAGWLEAFAEQGLIRYDPMRRLWTPTGD